MMKSSYLAFALALGLSASFAAMARADDMLSPAQTAAMPAQSTEDAALRDYNANVNPNFNIPTTGIYDQADRYTGPTGTPLPGWGAVNGEGAGDNGG